MNHKKRDWFLYTFRVLLTDLLYLVSVWRTDDVIY